MYKRRRIQTSGSGTYESSVSLFVGFEEGENLICEIPITIHYEYEPYEPPVYTSRLTCPESQEALTITDVDIHKDVGEFVSSQIEKYVRDEEYYYNEIRDLVDSQISESEEMYADQRRELMSLASA